MNNRNENKYYSWWKKNKVWLSILPAIAFWLISAIFFINGLSFKNPMIIFGFDASTAIAIALSLSNTIIQIIGNEQEKDDIGIVLWAGWMASYVLGIGTNIYGILSVLSIDFTILEWMVAIGLGTMIEVMPEKMIVMALKSVKPKDKKPSNNLHNVNDGSKPTRPQQPYQRPPQILDENTIQRLKNAQRQSS